MDKKVKLFIAIVLGLMMLPGLAVANISNTSIDVSPNFTNHNTQIEVGFLYDRQNNPGQRLSAGEDQVVITFPAGYELPSSISASHVTLNSINVINPVVDQSARTVTFVTPQNLHNQNPATVRFTVLAGIRNPANPSTGNQFGIAAGNFTGNTPGFTINQSNTTVSTASVAPNPSVEFFPAEYQVGFTVGAGGYLNSNDKVFIQFPSGTIVPTGSMAGVTVNGTTAIAVGTGSRNVEVIMPFAVQNNGALQIKFRIASGLRNAPAGQRTINVHTTSEIVPVTSDLYNLSPVDELSFSSISTTKDTVSANTRYEVDFFTGMPGNLVANEDRIELTLPENTLIPATINPSLITIQNSEGFTDSPTNIIRSGNTLIMTTPVNIGSNTNVRVTIRAAAGFRNPSQPGNYIMTARTSRPDNTPINEITPSNPFAVIASDTRVSTASVSLNESGANQTANYTINFSTGANGRLGSVNTITLNFPSGTNIGSASVTMNGQSASASASGQTLTIQVPNNVTVSNSGQVNLVVSGVQNPSTQGTKSLSIHTSAEPTPRFSNNYSIGGTSISIGSLNVNPQGANRVGAYNIWVNTNGTYRRDDNDYIRIFFPNGTILPETVNPAHVNIEGGSNVSASQVITDPESSVMDIYLTAGNNSTFSMWGILISADAGIINPPLPNSGNNDNSTLFVDAYRLTIVTSKQPSPAESPTYNIQPNNGTNVTINSMTASPNLGGYTGAAYTLRFTPGPLGRVSGGTAAGSNYIFINFYDDTAQFPATINASDVTVNGTAASVVERLSNTQARIYIPEGVSLAPGQEAEIRFSSAVGMISGSAGGINVSKGFQIRLDNSYSPEAGQFFLSSEVNTSFDSITLSNDTRNASSGYTIRITLGNDDAITAGQEIDLTFPNNTFVPETVNSARIRVNGQQISQNAQRTDTRTLTFESPVAVGVGEEAAILISSNAGILNPTSPGTSYSLTATLPSNNAYSSPSYSIVSGSSTITIPNVELSDATPQQNSNYTVNFRTGEYGRLISGTSTITVRFPEGMTFGSVNGAEINGETAAYQINAGQREVSVTVPSGVTIGNETNISLVINGVTNPNIESTNVTLRVRTSVETQLVTSNTFALTSSPPLAINSFVLNSPLVNQNLDFEVEFLLGSPLAANDGRIHVQFLDDYGIPVDLGLTGVTLRNSEDDVFELTGSQVNFNNSSISFIINESELTGGVYTLAIETAANIRNPREPGDSYQINMWTSGQPMASLAGIPVYQPSNISTISGLIAQYDQNIPNTPTEWKWEFTTGSLGALKPGVGRIFLRYPTTVNVPSNISANEIRVNGAVAQGVTVSGQELQITVPFSATIGNNSEVEVTINPAANIQFNGTSGSIQENNRSGSDIALNAEILSGHNFAAFTSAENSEEFGDSSILPIELESFAVNTTSGGFPELKWITVTEKENSGFEIYRRFNEDDSNWTFVEFIQGAGNSTERITYTFADQNLDRAGTYQYRMVQIDYDGTETISGELEYLHKPPEHFELAQNYPNPFNPTTNIQYAIAEQSEVSLIVYDILGRRVQILVNQQVQPGNYTAVFDASHLASGVYFVRMVAAGQVMTRKMQLIK